MPGGTLIVATPLNSVTATLRSLRNIEVAVSVAVILLLAVLTALIVRRDLRPIEAMTADADAIAGGDLTRRVEPAEGAGEVGRLSRALNRMLGEIEGALAEQTGPRTGCAPSWPTPPTNCGRRSPSSGATPNCCARRPSPTTTPASGPWPASRARPPAWGRSSRTCWCWPGGPRAGAAAARRPGRRHPRRRPRRRHRGAGPVASLSAPDAAPVLADEQRLGQVAHNLLQNALVHTPPGTPVRVRVALEADRAVLEVATTGRAWNPKRPPRCSTGSTGPTPRASKGTGLGLFIVATLVRSLGGTIELDTAPGRGARFTVGLPGPPTGPGAGRRPVRPGGRSRTGRTGAASGGARVPRGGMLAVDDAGDGPAVVLLHGQPGTAAAWAPVRAALVGAYRVVVPDRPGYGATDVEAMGIAANAAVMVEMMAERGLAPAIVVGHSWGGGVAAWMAARTPRPCGGSCWWGRWAPPTASTASTGCWRGRGRARCAAWPRWSASRPCCRGSAGGPAPCRRHWPSPCAGPSPTRASPAACARRGGGPCAPSSSSNGRWWPSCPTWPGRSRPSACPGGAGRYPRPGRAAPLGPHPGRGRAHGGAGRAGRRRPLHPPGRTAAVAAAVDAVAARSAG